MSFHLNRFSSGFSCRFMACILFISNACFAPQPNCHFVFRFAFHVFHVDFGFPFMAFAFSRRQPFLSTVSFCFRFSCFIFLSNMFMFHAVLDVFPVHCVLVSRYVVLCLFPVCVYSYIQLVSFAKKHRTIFQRHFGWGARQALLMNKIHAMRSHENPNETLHDNPSWQWKTIIYSNM